MRSKKRRAKNKFVCKLPVFLTLVSAVIISSAITPSAHAEPDQEVNLQEELRLKSVPLESVVACEEGAASIAYSLAGDSPSHPAIILCKDGKLSLYQSEDKSAEGSDK